MVKPIVETMNNQSVIFVSFTKGKKFKHGTIPASLCSFSYFFNSMKNIFDFKNLDDVLGIRTQDEVQTNRLSYGGSQQKLIYAKVNCDSVGNYVVSTTIELLFTVLRAFITLATRC